MSSRGRREFLSFAGLSLLIGSAASAERWVEGRHYFRISDPQAPAQRSAVARVTEVFSYGCPGCHAFLPYMQRLERMLPHGTDVEYLPASWIAAENWPVFQRTYLTARTLGVDKQAHEAMFAAVWRTGELAIIDARSRRPRKPLPSVQDVARFYERATAVAAARFMSIASSFAVDSAIRLAEARIRAIRAESTPTLVINDRYRLDLPSAGGADQMVEATLFLLQKDARTAAH